MSTPSIKSRRSRKNRFVVKRGALPPSAQVLHFSPDQWEQFIEAACFQRPLHGGGRYAFVKQLGGAGDGGRDIEARIVPTLETDRWDLYQAKRYDSGLTPGDTFPELAKFFKHLSGGTYPRPRFYFLSAPRGVGNDLHDLIASPATFKARFLADWTAGVTGLKGRSGELTPSVRALIDAFDFGRIRECQLRELLRWHERDVPAHHALFGIEPERGDDPQAPAVPTHDEQVYVEQLVRVYGEHHGASLNLDDVMAAEAYSEHFQAQRAVFYCAEGLKRFSRDLYSDDEFDRLLNMVLTGVRPSVHHPRHKTGMERFDAGMTSVSSLHVTDSKLSGRLRAGDLPGTCHHLVNQKKLKWLK